MKNFKILLFTYFCAAPVFSVELVEEYNPKGRCHGIAKIDSLSVEYDGEKKACFLARNIKGELLEECPAIIKKGGKIYPSQLNKNIATKTSTLCEKGGHCYPAENFILSDKCKFVKAKDEILP